jgi:MFS superfamily sulfate permease-like transporter
MFDPLYGFLAALLVYMVYSEWVGLDSRYVVGAALVLLVIDAVIDAGGATNLANTVAVYVFFLLAAGVVLLLVDQVREARKVPGKAAASDS